MAKKVKLQLNGTTAYPITITDAIADVTTSKKLSTVLTEIKGQATGWKIQKDTTNDLVYYLKDSAGTTQGTINIPQDTFLEDVQFNGTTNDLTFIFNTVSGKQNVVANLASLIDTYTAGNGLSVSDKSFSIKIAENSQPYVSVTADGLAITGVNEALALKADKSDTYTKSEITTMVSDINIDIAGNTQAITNETTRATGVEEGLRSDLGTKTDASTLATAFGRIAKVEEDLEALTGSGAGTIQDQISSAIDTLKGDMVYDTIGEFEDVVAEHIADTTVHITAQERVAWNDKVDATVVGTTEYDEIDSIIS